jgi:hypothetical protein
MMKSSVRKGLAKAQENLENLPTYGTAGTGASANQDLAQVLNQTLFGARACPRCHFGPVIHAGCDNLSTHHGQGNGEGYRISNACPNCGFFSEKKWPEWNGKIIDPNRVTCWTHMRYWLRKIFCCCCSAS